MNNSVNNINKIINYGYRKKYSFLDINITKKDINKYDGYVILYIINDENLRFWVIEKYFFPKIKKIKIFKNLFNDDKSITYLLYIKENEEELIYYIHYLYYFNYDILIYNKKMENILNYIKFKDNNDVLNEYKELRKIYINVAKKYKINNDLYFTAFKNKYIKPITINFAKAELISYNFLKNNNRDITDVYNLYNTLLMDMLKIKKSDLKRSTELFYLKKFRDIFPDTIYQYKPKWLEKQTIDIYIPSKKVGIEIQGEQHYKAINFFGGEQQFKKQKELDKKKKELCKKNKVNLYFISNCKINYENTTFDSIIDKILKK